ncbi:CHAT domain-containing protein [Paraburkholderia caballeronis]|uniref:CHAT domain-containing protein n=1 Tax=Paraburkholderia caballeronis TaxID=416943 RepID=UPI00106643CB|nr:CHAT domain-containing protein [Paraburkholderia caballeronis]TDV07180.1 CHAT domain-containing protein [Paraburkholderia caballeronis]TDV11324.1 CHAT domain-containing protein [Paraburkholderia caballeronis]TDV22509.1 CHAT domain-containing protein [Paraburkholderia caballeronis]
MPILDVPGSDIAYFLILFDKDGNERAEADGSLTSGAIAARLNDRANPVTDVFVCSHGWQGDVPAAIDQYNRWIAAMAGCGGDVAAMQAQRAGFNPMVIGLHWPSLPWGMETVPAGAGGLLGIGGGASPDADIDALAEQFGDADADTTREALGRIFGYAQTATATALPASVLDDFAALFNASGLRTGSAGGRPGADQDGFDPQQIVNRVAKDEAAAASAAGAAVAVAATAAAVATGTPGTAGTAAAATTGLLGIGDKIRDAVLAPLRQLSFWTMKDRARRFGESGAHALLVAMQDAAPAARFHLMGHSFGCIVASGMVAGGGAVALRRPVDSLMLVQGALSLWSYADDVPFAPGKPGYFQRIVMNGLVRGPIVTTRSKYDTAVGRFYPLGAAVKDQYLLGEGGFPKYGGVGAFGLQGVGHAVDQAIAASGAPYEFGAARVVNLEASDVIRNGDGPAGAHSDIAHPEVAHAFWSAALAGDAGQGRTLAASVDGAFGFDVPATVAVPVGVGAGAAAGVGAGGTFAGVGSGPKRGGLLGIDDGSDATAAPAAGGGFAFEAPPAAAAPPPPPAATPATPAAPSSAFQQSGVEGPPRWINASFDDLAPGDPLVKGNWYTLGFGVDVKQLPASAGASSPFVEQGVFAPDAHDVVLTVQLDTDDFDTSGHTAPMRVPRAGKGYTKARFDLSPRHDGPCALTATVLKDGQFIQQLALTFVAGAAGAGAQTDVETRGRALGGVAVLQPRDLSLQIYPADNGYECVLCGAVATHVRLPVNAGLIDAYIRDARSNLMQVVMYQDPASGYVFQSGIDIPQSALDAALPVMAQAGALLMITLFDGPGAGDDVRAVGNALRQLGTQPEVRLKIQIVAETLPVPWPLLYLGDASGAVPLNWDNFLGMRHVIEQIPLQNPMTVMEPQIASAPSLNVSLNFHEGIDAAMGVDVVAAQRAFWKGRSGTTITDRTKRADFINALRQAETPDQILYLYCHAVSTNLTDPVGPGGSKLELTDQLISLNDLKLGAPSSARLAGKPLVFINACESAEMSPTFYDGFAPYFMDKGARGVIGTECKTPALFAKEWALRFFDRFLGGETLGETVLALRREFLERHRNPLGLLYAVHCDADTAIRPALPGVAVPAATTATTGAATAAGATGVAGVAGG